MSQKVSSLIALTFFCVLMALAGSLTPALAEDGIYVLERASGLHRIGNTPIGELTDVPLFAVDFEISEDGRGIYFLNPDGVIQSVGAGARFRGVNLETRNARRMALSRQGLAILDANGGVHFGDGQPALPWNIYFGWDIARDIELTPEGDGMVVLDGMGGLHVRGNLPRLVSPFFGWDIARDVELSPDRQGYYVLDGFGFIHSIGPIRPFVGVDLGEDIAKDLELTQSGNGFYILDALGGLHVGGDALPFNAPFFGWDVATDLEIAPAAQGALSGRVIAQGSNGQERPAAGAIVSLIRIGISPDVLRPSEDGSARTELHPVNAIQTRCNANGVYRFPAIPAGPYRVLVRLIGHEEARGEVDVIAGENTVRDFVLLAREVVEPPFPAGRFAGSVAEDTGLLTVYIPIANARVSVFITNRQVLTARTNENGEFVFERVPAGRHPVYVEAQGYRPLRSDIVIEEGRTARAAYRLARLPDTKGRVFGTVWYDSAADCTPEANCPSSPEPVAGAQLHLVPRDVPFLMNPVEGTNLVPEPDTIGWFTTSDEDGRYEFNDIPLGLYVLIVRAEGFAPAWRHFFLGTCGEEEIAPLAGDATEGQNLCPEREVNIRLFPVIHEFGSLYGRVQGLTGTDSALAVPLEGAVVHAIPEGNIQPGVIYPEDDRGRFGPQPFPVPPLPFIQITDSQGNYRFEKLPAGRYQLVVTARGYLAQRREVFLPVGAELEENFVLLPMIHDTGAIEGVVAGAPLDSTAPQENAEPIEGAVVVLVPQPRPPVAEGSPLPVQDAVMGEMDLVPALISDMEVNRRYRTATTAADGSYRFDNVPVGHYQLIARARGFFPQHQEADVLKDETTVVNFLLRPRPPVRFGALVGSVTDEVSGESVAQAVVTAWPLNVRPLEQRPPARSEADRLYHSPECPEPLRTLTDENGNYEFPRLLAGPYRVEVRARGYAPAGRPVVVEPGQVTVLNFALRPRPPRGAVMGRVFEKTNSGEPGRPIPGARVALIPWDLAVAQEAESGILRDSVDPAGHIFYTRTDMNGFYQFPEVPAGKYLLRVHKFGYEPARRQVTVPPGATIHEDFALMPLGVPPRGSVVGAVYSVAPEGQDPQPIPGAYVFLMPGVRALGATSVHPEFVARTNEAGEFQFEEVPAGDYLILAHAEGFLKEYRRIEVRADEVTHVNFFLTPGASEPVARIFGHVSVWADPNTDQASVPIPEVKMLLFQWPENLVTIPELELMDPSQFPGRLVLSTWTNREGYYEFRGLPGGLYILFAVKEGFRRGAEPVELGPNEQRQVDFALQRLEGPPPPEDTAVVFGTVRTPGLNSAGGTTGTVPVPDALVSAVPEVQILIWPPPPPITTRTDQNGHYRLPPLFPGSWIIKVEKAGFKPDEETVRLEAGDRRELNFLLERENTLPPPQGGVIEGIVWTKGPAREGMNWTKVPVPGARLVFHPDTIVTLAPIVTMTDSMGRFRMALPADGFTVTISKEGFQTLEDRVKIEPGSVVRKEYELIPVEQPAGVR